MGDLGVVALTIADALLTAILWRHCAKPALVHAGARPRALRVVLSMGIVSWLAMALQTALYLMDRPSPLLVRAVMLITAVWFLAAWNQPVFVAGLSGGRYPEGTLRRIVWGLGATLDRVRRGLPEPRWRSEATVYRLRLERSPRSATTSRFIDLWLAEATAVLGDDPSFVPDETRHAHIRDEAKRIWPDGDDWKSAALV